MTLTEKHIMEVTAYIQKWDNHLQLYFGDRVDIAGKRVLVVGSGWGTEILWCLKKGAERVVGIDPRSEHRVFVERALANGEMGHLADRFEMLATTLPEAGDIGTFDFILTNNTLEHVFGLSATFCAMSRYIPDPGARIYVQASPLFYSSMGHHMPVGAWEHLSLSQDDLRAKVSPLQWGEYREGLSGMTLTSFLEAVREAGLVLTDLGILLDPNIGALAEAMEKLPSALKPMDLACQGVKCTLAFPHNL